MIVHSSEVKVLVGWGFGWGAFRSTLAEKKKTTSEKCKASMRALSFFLDGFAHTRKMHSVQK